MRVLEQLRVACGLGPRDAETAPLGEADDPDGSTLLAGRFHEARLQEVRGAIERGGGEVVADVDEDLTVPRGDRHAPPADTPPADPGRRYVDARRGRQMQVVTHHRV